VSPTRTATPCKVLHPPPHTLTLHNPKAASQTPTTAPATPTPTPPHLPSLRVPLPPQRLCPSRNSSRYMRCQCSSPPYHPCSSCSACCSPHPSLSSSLHTQPTTSTSSCTTSSGECSSAGSSGRSSGMKAPPSVQHDARHLSHVRAARGRQLHAEGG
ncbi:unnamed protein product, partial [Closterium sp. NIES-54]